ncbi:MAG: hypothetical protein LBS31_01560, partial [Candidatus Adiutrix sp.]|nr:hypothetical protein [Candidatus Adiutrix sp.]
PIYYINQIIAACQTRAKPWTPDAPHPIRSDCSPRASLKAGARQRGARPRPEAARDQASTDLKTE